MVVATVHGKDITQVVSNPELNTLLGGLKETTLSDEMARERGNKIALTHATRSRFGTIIEVDTHEWRIIH